MSWWSGRADSKTEDATRMLLNLRPISGLALSHSKGCVPVPIPNCPKRSTAEGELYPEVHGNLTLMIEVLTVFLPSQPRSPQAVADMRRQL